MTMITNPEDEVSFYKFSKGFDLTHSIAEKYSTNVMIPRDENDIVNLMQNYDKSVLPFSAVYQHTFKSLPIPKYYSWELWQQIYNKYYSIYYLII
jgi:hypothetical protein